VFNCTAGAGSLDALHAAGAERLAGKTFIDVANPLDFSHGMPRTLSPVGSDILGEQIQREFPDTRVVKALNTVNC
jgi:predicted dinucleotide-binding enzyme